MHGLTTPRLNHWTEPRTLYQIIAVLVLIVLVASL
jgi:hypothetical protein